MATPILGDRTVILTGSAARSHRMARFFADAGAHPVPVELGSVPSQTRARFAAYERLLAKPIEETWRRFNVADPDGAALVYAGSFSAVQSVCGRPVVGARSAAHLAVERKDKQRELLGLVGQVVSLAAGRPELTGPVVMQGIPDDGVAMATSHTYLIPSTATEEQVAKITDKLRRDCTQALVSGFEAGIPCTFYGFITASNVFDLGPVEALVYWDRHGWRIHAPGILRPLPMTSQILAAARAEVASAAARLHQQTGYLGAFGTDGVVTGDRYVIHEINPRICAGFSLLDQLAPAAAPLAAIDLVLRENPGRAAAALAEPLAALAFALSSDPTPTYRLWDATDHSVRGPDEPGPNAQWAQRVRASAARADLLHITEFMEPLGETDPAKQR